ncbi:MAG: hypothetical protein K6T35_08475 [Meiothermus silvanus]|nr:hypothetical protein [Allomeiothermus silvanus]
MDRADEIAALGARAREAFDDKHRSREVMLAASRKAIQACAASIRATHRGEYEAAEELAREARDHVAEADRAICRHADVRTNGPLSDAKKELAEAWFPHEVVSVQVRVEPPKALPE